jgi:hypothetical protein
LQSFPPPAPAIFSAEGRLRRHRSRRRVVEAFRSPAMVSGFRRRPLCLARVKPPWRTSHTVLTPLPHARTRPQDNPHQHSGHQRGAPGCRPAADAARKQLGFVGAPIAQRSACASDCATCDPPGMQRLPPMQIVDKAIRLAASSVRLGRCRGRRRDFRQGRVSHLSHRSACHAREAQSSGWRRASTANLMLVNRWQAFLRAAYAAKWPMRSL